jgi:hypothetical protein
MRSFVFPNFERQIKKYNEDKTAQIHSFWGAATNGMAGHKSNLYREAMEISDDIKRPVHLREDRK